MAVNPKDDICQTTNVTYHPRLPASDQSDGFTFKCEKLRFSHLKSDSTIFG
jgi:hypothetical protein